MAIVSRQMAASGDSVELWVDYDDSNLRLTAMTCINNSASPAWGQAQRVAIGRIYAQTFPPMQTTTIDIPTNPSGRMSITITPNGRIDGVDWSFMWPA